VVPGLDLFFLDENPLPEIESNRHPMSAFVPSYQILLSINRTKGRERIRNEN